MLTLQFVPYAEISALNSGKRIKKLLSIVQDNKIALLEGRLKSEEEAELIRVTMENIDEKFTGIELTVIYPESKDTDLMKKIKRALAKILLGDREGFTIIGPASVIKEIKKDPDKIQLFTVDSKEPEKKEEDNTPKKESKKKKD